MQWYWNTHTSHSYSILHCITHLDPFRDSFHTELTKLFAESRNPEELKYAWETWRKVSGAKYRDQYLEFIEIQNNGSKALGFDDLQKQWLEHYEDEDFPAYVQRVWTEAVDVEGKTISLEIFYKQFHAYVRNKLKQFYNPKVI